MIWNSIQSKVKYNKNYPKASKVKKPRFAVLIPARYEANVIEELLKSIESQTFKIDMKDVYVIIESIEDETYNIAKRYGAEVVIRQKLDLRRKGYALDEGIKYVLNKGVKYDAYFIFDADNVLSPTYMEEMSKTYLESYDIGIGYRNTKNGNANVIAGASSMTFSMINTLGNKAKNEDTRNKTISGTGFYIKGSIVEEWGGYPFHTLTEDYELSLYATLHSYTTYYNESAEYYDEQPISMKVSITQRTRWIKGFFEARKLYKNELLESSKDRNPNSGSQYEMAKSIEPYIFLVVGFILNIIIKVVWSIILLVNKSSLAVLYLLSVGLILLMVYSCLFIATYIMLKKDRKLALTRSSKFKVLFFNPIFLCTYIHSAILAIVKKNLGWDKIKHTS